MTSVNIMIKKEAYDFLTSIKGNKSYSQVILSFKKEKVATLHDFVGVLSKNEGEELRTRVAKFRNEMNDEFDKRQESHRSRK